jgi:excisionase family DNA binding protein
MEQPKPIEKPWTVNELSEFLTKSKSWIYHAAENGEIPAFKVGGHWRFSPSEIQKWLTRQSNQVAAIS